MRTTIPALVALWICGCGAEPALDTDTDTDTDIGTESQALDGLAPAAAGSIYNIEPNDVFASESTVSDLFYARTAPMLAGDPYGWWSRLDLGFENTTGSPVTVTGFDLDSNDGAAQVRMLSEPAVVNAGLKRRLEVPGAISGTGNPSSLAVDVLLSGGATVTRTVGFHRFDAPTANGGFRFPGRREDLAPGEYWFARAHSQTEEQSLAYDFTAVRWTGSAWTTTKALGDPDNHEDKVIWGKPVYAIADGYVVRCVRSVEDNLVDGGGGNTIIQDIGNGQYLSYHHMKQDSVPLALCPTEGPGPGGVQDPLHIFVRAGTQIGNVGHTGASSQPHLHLQLNDSLPKGPDSAKLRSLPLAFHDIDVHRRDDNDDASDPSTWTRIHADKPAALYVEADAYLVDPNPCGWVTYDPDASEITRHGIPAACYQDVVAAVVEAGFRLVQVDGYDVGGATFFNALWQPEDGVPWAARHGLTAAEYQDAVEDMLDAGQQLLHADSYLQGGAVRYAAIFRAGLPNRAAYHGLTAAQHQAKVDTWPALGYHPVSVSVVSVGGARQYTAVWEQSAFPGWVLSSAIPAASLTSTIATNTGAGRKLWALDAYRHDGAVFFAALFGTAGPTTTVSPQNTAAGHQTAMDFWLAAGRDTRLVTGFESSGQARFVGVWTN